MAKKKSYIENVLIGLERHAHALLTCLAAGKSALLIGETGTGKTSLAVAAAGELSRDCVRVNLDGGSTPDELIGRFQLKGTETFFQKGVIPQAMESGSVLILDEINAALPDTLFACHPLLESEPRLYIPETGETIKPAPGFAVVATMNPSHEYAGTKGLNAALYSRFGIVLRFSPLSGEKLIQALSLHDPGAEPEAVTSIALLFEKLSSLRAEEAINTRITLRECISALALIRAGLELEDAIGYAIGSKLESPELSIAINKNVGFSRRSIGLTKPSRTVSELLERINESDAVFRENKKLTKRIAALSSLEELAKAFKAADIPRPETEEPEAVSA